MKHGALIAACLWALMVAVLTPNVWVADANASTKASQSNAKKTTQKKNTAKAKKQSSVPAPDKFAAVVVDVSTGQVLYEKNADKQRFPASLTKMMTLYLTFDALKKRKITLDTRLPVSAKAAAQPQTNISLKAGDRIRVRDAIEALVVRSANDASLVLAEHLGKTQWNFALKMTQKARELGMRDTIFKNPHGLPDSGQVTNAYDMARLGIALQRDFPEYFDYFKTSRFEYNGATYTTHNRVMLRYDGADGIKTGYIRASGFNLVTSARKNGHQLVAVVMGGKSATERDDTMIALLNRSVAQLDEKHHNQRIAESFLMDGTGGNSVNTQPLSVSSYAVGTAAASPAMAY